MLVGMRIWFGMAVFALGAAAWAQQSKLSAPQLIALAQSGSPKLESAIRSNFDAKAMTAGTAWMGKGADFFFAIEGKPGAQLAIDDRAPVEMTPAGASGLAYAVARVEPVGRLHGFHYVVEGKPFGGTVDMPAFGPLSYAIPGTPQGKLSEKRVHVSKIYDGMKSDFWVYVPAQYDPAKPAALMVFTDGASYTHRDGNFQALNVFDNLIAQGKMPVTIFVMTMPGDVADAPGTPTYATVQAFADKWKRTLKDAMRSTEYDTVSDRYGRFLRDELLPEALAGLNVRKDAYSHAISGSSSGGICSFNAAWWMPEQFSRVHSWIGSFTAIQWEERPEVREGGQNYPEKVLRETHRNVRIWLQDGANDQENDRYGSWPLANIRMANALKEKGYDFHFNFGNGTHNPGQGEAEFPESLTWLWRGYDPAKTEQTYEMEPEEKAKPVFRVGIVNR
jgi:enterochelin esterase-like enzyme